MKFLRDMNNKMAPMFNKGEKFERLYPLLKHTIQAPSLLVWLPKPRAIFVMLSIKNA